MYSIDEFFESYGRSLLLVLLSLFCSELPEMNEVHTWGDSVEINTSAHQHGKSKVFKNNNTGKYVD